MSGPRDREERRLPAAFEPNLATTGVGSLPHLSPGEAVADVLEFCPEYPYWPQLPRLSPREDMYRQFSAGLPGVVTAGFPDPAGADVREREASPPAVARWRRDRAALDAMERVYRDVLALASADPLESWRIDPDDARGLQALRDVLTGRPGGTERPAGIRGLKGQVTGPISLGLAVTDAGGRALLYEEDLMDGVARGLALRARWQERFLTGLVAQGTTLLSVDEPYLGTFGSAYFPYRPETVLAYLQVFDETLDGVWGVHCCANTDWEFVLASPVRFVSFDAYAYGERVTLYPEAVRRFLAEGKVLVWGIVPTTADTLAAEDAPGLTRRLLGLFEALVARGVSEGTLTRQSMITPACGLAGLSVEEARRAMALAQAVSQAVRSELGDNESLRTGEGKPIWRDRI